MAEVICLPKERLVLEMLFKKEEGQAMVEFALVLPILFLLLSGILDFSWIYGNQLLVNNAGREAARYTAVHYYDSSVDDDEAIAAGIVSARAPTLSSPTVNLQKTSDMITISVQSDISVLTPFVSAIIGDTYTVNSTISMRLE